MALVRDFENNELDIARLNYVMLTLIPKEENVVEIKKIQTYSPYQLQLQNF